MLRNSDYVFSGRVRRVSVNSFDVLYIVVMCSYKIDILYALAQNGQICGVEKINLLKNYGVSKNRNQIKMRIHIKQIAK